MAKPVRYPKRLREKLDAIAAKRDAREAEADQAEPDDDAPPYRTFYHSFLGKGTVHTMYARIDEIARRMVTRYVLDPPAVPRRIFIRPPWEDDPRDAAE